MSTSPPGSRPRVIVVCDKCGRRLSWRVRRHRIVCCRAYMRVEGHAPARSITIGGQALPLPATLEVPT